MLILGIHTADASCDIALLQDGELKARRQESMKRGQDQRLPLLLEGLLDEASVKIADLDEIVVCVGPGSFTGIRVGVAFARGLALAAGLTARGVTSLEAMFAADPTARAMAFLPAKKRPPDISFWAQGQNLELLDDPEEMSAGNLTEIWPADCLALTPEDHREGLQAFLPAETPIQAAQSDAVGTALFAARSHSPARPAIPVYAREPDAIPAKPVARLAD